MSNKHLLGFYDYTVILTYAGTLSAFHGILSLLNNSPRQALICLMISGVCDMFDGTIAATKDRNRQEKRFGIQIDSLNDIVAFGVLPALFVYIFCPQPPPFPSGSLRLPSVRPDPPGLLQCLGRRPPGSYRPEADGVLRPPCHRLGPHSPGRLRCPIPDSGLPPVRLYPCLYGPAFYFPHKNPQAQAEGDHRTGCRRHCPSPWNGSGGINT